MTTEGTPESQADKREYRWDLAHVVVVAATTLLLALWLLLSTPNAPMS
ncbi:MAG: hypothetical protein LCH76_06195 [Actinobacteria bacterium]|nr:hypothetical protein [Actinomycetota bacterium]